MLDLRNGNILTLFYWNEDVMILKKLVKNNVYRGLRYDRYSKDDKE